MKKTTKGSANMNHKLSRLIIWHSRPSIKSEANECWRGDPLDLWQRHLSAHFFFIQTLLIIPSHFHLSQQTKNELRTDTDEEDSTDLDDDDSSSDASTNKRFQVSARSRNTARRSNIRHCFSFSDRSRKNLLPPMYGTTTNIIVSYF